MVNSEENMINVFQRNTDHYDARKIPVDVNMCWVVASYCYAISSVFLGVLQNIAVWEFKLGFCLSL